MLLMHRLALGAFATSFAALAGCLREKVPFCDNGAYCPEPLVCTERAAPPYCGEAFEVKPCENKLDEDFCELPGKEPGFCEAGFCKRCDENNAACDYPGWTAMDTPTGLDLSSLYVAGPRDVFAFGKTGTVIRWNGRAWSLLVPGPTTDDIRAVTATSATNIYASAVANVYRFDGTAWSLQETSPHPVLAMWSTTPDHVWTAGLLATTGYYNGSTWVEDDMTLNLTVSLNGLWGSSVTDVFAVGQNGTVLHWNGAWSQQSTSTTYILLAAWGSSSTDVYAVGRTAGGLPIALHYNGTWSDVTTTLPPTGTVALQGIWGSSSSNIYVVGQAGTILHFDGSAWSALTSNTTANLTAVGGSGTDVFAVGAGGTVLRYRE